MKKRPIEERIDRLLATVAVQRHLLLAIFDASENKDFIISQFSDVSDKEATLTLFSEMSEEFYEEFQIQRSGLLEILGDS